MEKSKNNMEKSKNNTEKSRDKEQIKTNNIM